MIPIVVLSLLVALPFGLSGLSTDAYASPKKGTSVKEVKAMSEKEQTALALSAAPKHIAKEAGVMVFGAEGKLTEVKKSENGFTCIPTVMNLPDPDPICMDGAAHQWMTDIIHRATPSHGLQDYPRLTEIREEFEQVTGGNFKRFTKQSSWDKARRAGLLLV